MQGAKLKLEVIFVGTGKDNPILSTVIVHARYYFAV